MCRVCVAIQKTKKANGADFLTDEQIGTVLGIIAHRMRDKTEDRAHLEELMDEVLGTKLPERNRDVEAAWEQANRKNDG